MGKRFLLGFVLVLCAISLALHLSVESAGMLNSAWLHGVQTYSPLSHGEEDHFVPVMAQDERQSHPDDFPVPVTYSGGISLSIIPQLPPPKSI